MLPPDIDERLSSISALHDPVRRALYLHVLGERREVSRDEAAAAVGVRRGLAAFHLDRLAADGLVEVEYRRLSGRSGPGAGRPAKLYRAAADERDVSLPPRSYALAAELLAAAVDSGRSPGQVAREAGLAMAAELDVGHRASGARKLAAVADLLAVHGYQPVAVGRGLRLRNCPFHALADRHTELVCGMNEALLGGLLEGLGVTGVEARLEPTPGECCVTLVPRKRS